MGSFKSTYTLIIYVCRRGNNNIYDLLNSIVVRLSSISNVRCPDWIRTRAIFDSGNRVVRGYRCVYPSRRQRCKSTHCSSGGKNHNPMNDYRCAFRTICFLVVRLRHRGDADSGSSDRRRVQTSYAWSAVWRRAGHEGSPTESAVYATHRRGDRKAKTAVRRRKAEQNYREYRRFSVEKYWIFIYDAECDLHTE